MSTGKRGPRPAGTDTREAIVHAARKQFSEKGYQGTTLRGVGAAAGVDPRLVLHYFGNKQQLFMQSLELPLAPAAVIERLAAPGPSPPATPPEADSPGRQVSAVSRCRWCPAPGARTN